MLPGEVPARGEVASRSKSFAVGAYAVGGSLAGLQKTTKLFTAVTRVLCNVVGGLDNDLALSAVGIFRNLQTSPHKDSGNQAGCENLVPALSGFNQGGIWLESSEGEVSCPFSGYSNRGVVLEIPPGGHIRFDIRFDPRQLRCTMPWSGGDRTVLVAYTPFCGPSLKEDDRATLMGLGFQLSVASFPSEPVSTPPSREAKSSTRKRAADGTALWDDSGDGTSAKSSARKHPSDGAALWVDNGDGTSAKSSARTSIRWGGSLWDDSGDGTSAKSSARKHPSDGAALWVDNGDGTSAKSSARTSIRWGGSLWDDNGDGSSEWWQSSRQSGHWIQDPEGSTSEEDEDGYPVAPRGSGKLGWGPALVTRAGGKTKLYSDGHGLASPGRWPPHARPCADHDPELVFHRSLMDHLLHFITDNIDYKRVVCFLATGKCTTSPFSDAVMDQARQLVFKFIRDQGSLNCSA